MIIIIVISLLTYYKQISIYKLKVEKEVLKPIYNSFWLKKTLLSSTIFLKKKKQMLLLFVIRNHLIIFWIKKYLEVKIRSLRKNNSVLKIYADNIRSLEKI